jgi:hypothetical protein
MRVGREVQGQPVPGEDRSEGCAIRKPAQLFDRKTPAIEVMFQDFHNRFGAAGQP